MRTYLTAVAITICLLACNKQSPVKPSTEGVGPAPDTTVTVPPPPIPPKDTIDTLPPVLYAVKDSLSTNIGGYYVALPASYQKDSLKTYPLIFFMHGAGVYGNGNSDLSKVLVEALPKLLNDKTFPPDFLVGGKHYSFIVMIPQFAKSPDNGNEVMSAIAYTKANYRIDPSRIYLTGISSGSVAGGYVAAAYPSTFAAIVPIAGITASQDGCQNMVEAKLPIWAFHNNGDQRINTSYTKDFVSMYNSLNPAIPARLTLFSPYGSLNHDAWTKAMDPSYKEDGKNMYEWMLQYSR